MLPHGALQGWCEALGCPSPLIHHLRACLGQDFAAFCPAGTEGAGKRLRGEAALSLLPF